MFMLALPSYVSKYVSKECEPPKLFDPFRIGTNVMYLST